MRHNRPENTPWPQDSESDDARKRIGHAIRRRRLELGYSMEETARRMGIHYRYLSDLERGQRNLGVLNLEKACRGLGIRQSLLFSEYGADDPRIPEEPEQPRPSKSESQEKPESG